MEEKKKQEKLSYEKLQQVAGDLQIQNQKMLQHIQKLQEALDDRNFNYTSFFLSMLFKVMEHPEMYDNKFVEWCANNIQNSLTAFASASQTEEEKKDEAE